MTQPALRPVTPVGLLVQALDEVAVLTRGADELVRARVRTARALAGGLDPYLAQSTSPESADLADLARRTAAHAFPEAGTLEAEMLSGHVEGQLLQVLVRATQARRVLEVGMFTGYSALAMAEALPDDGTVVALEIDPDVAAFAAERLDASAHGHKVTVEVGPAGDTLQRLAASGASYDLVFIDADKPGYIAYLDAVLGGPDGGLLAPHGLVCVDNTLMQGAAYGAGPESDNSRAIADFNARVAADDRVQQVLVPLRDGITLMTRRPTSPSTAAPTAKETP